MVVERGQVGGRVAGRVRRVWLRPGRQRAAQRGRVAHAGRPVHRSAAPLRARCSAECAVSYTRVSPRHTPSFSAALCMHGTAYEGSGLHTHLAQAERLQQSGAYVRQGKMWRLHAVHHNRITSR